MIIVRGPLRISLGGGGTDLPSYYRKHSGFLIAAAINKYVYITIHETFVDDLIIKYSKLERVPVAESIEKTCTAPELSNTSRNFPVASTVSSIASKPGGERVITGVGFPLASRW